MLLAAAHHKQGLTAAHLARIVAKKRQASIKFYEINLALQA